MHDRYYCDDCARRLTHEAFNGSRPSTMAQICVWLLRLVNVTKTVAPRQWFVCGDLLDVFLLSESIVASQAVHQYWRYRVTPVFPPAPFARKGGSLSFLQLRGRVEPSGRQQKPLMFWTFGSRNVRRRRAHLYFISS